MKICKLNIIRIFQDGFVGSRHQFTKRRPSRVASALAVLIIEVNFENRELNNGKSRLYCREFNTI